MGGTGSGRHWRHSTKNTTDRFLQLDVRRWAREAYLTPGRAFSWQWTRNGEKLASIRAVAEHGAVRLIYKSRSGHGDWRDMDYRVPLDWTPCHFGGERAWFRCPARGCGRRVAVLYGGEVFACRKCHDLAYPSQNEDAFSRSCAKSRKLESRLGWDESYGRKPKGMHWRTFERLVAEHDAADAMQASNLMRRFHALGLSHML